MKLTNVSKAVRKIVIAALKDHHARILTDVPVITAAERSAGIKVLNAICDRVAVKFGAPAPTLREKTRDRVKKALKVLGKRPTKVVNGTRFLDPKSMIAYAADRKAGRGNWACRGVKKTGRYETFTEGVILKNATPFQPKRAR